MARIRSIKPEFWTDDLIGSLARDYRLLFVATWNLADDEGLLRWSAPYLKGAVFPYDDDISVADVEKGMNALTASGMIYPYLGGKAQQKLAFIVNFHKHQKINRPSPSKLPPPSLQDVKIRYMYGARDGFKCHLCDGQIDEQPTLDNEDFVVSIDHIKPVSSGGGDYPSNLRAAHQCCNKGRGSRTVESYRQIVMNGKTVAQARYPERFTHLAVIDSETVSVSDSVSKSMNHSLLVKVEGRGIGGEKDQDAALSASVPARPQIDSRQLENQLRAAAGLEQSPAPALADLSPILGLIDAGLDLETEILPVIRAKAKPNIGSWRFFVQACHDSRASRQSAANGHGHASARAPPAPAGKRNPVFQALEKNMAKRQNE